MENSHLPVPEQAFTTTYNIHIQIYLQTLNSCLLDFIFTFIEKLGKFRKEGNKMDSEFQRILRIPL